MEIKKIEGINVKPLKNTNSKCAIMMFVCVGGKTCAILFNGRGPSFFPMSTLDKQWYYPLSFFDPGLGCNEQVTDGPDLDQSNTIDPP
jgi:hypothetical protein